MELVENGKIFAPDVEDKKICQLAAEASSESKPLLPISYSDEFFCVDERWSPRVLQGLAKISLRETGYDYPCLNPERADRIIDELSGDVEYFFYPILAAAAKKNEPN